MTDKTSYTILLTIFIIAAVIFTGGVIALILLDLWWILLIMIGVLASAIFYEIYNAPLIKEDE